jgi:hypothetical protein
VIKYHLDDLGWYQFESLVQSLLKAELGIVVEAWGDHSDRGRDAFTTASLRFPDRRRQTAGPFVFQVKFVQAANAKGAKPREGLLKAINAECRMIQSRRMSQMWIDPKWYVLLTNAPLTSSTRAAIAEILKPAIPSAEIVTLGGRDVCGLLDSHPELRRSFPEIMSLRDLDVLLKDAVNHSIIERSKAAIEEAREALEAFVQTENYHKAFQILNKHSFVVLDGPPEMGKTAIARVLSIAQLSLGWDALDCRTPNDLLTSYDSNRKQLFVVDDAFGRTEYVPNLGRLWEQDLSKVLHKVDRKHWLIWTTRKHILARALKDMDLTGKASSFPEPGELIVTADALSNEEKAKILYRHARAGNLENTYRMLVRTHATLIVSDSHFTPERIRRFISERIPELATQTKGKPLTPEQLKKEVVEAIRNPTKRMQKAFRKLSDAHKWILISLLDCESFAAVKDIRNRFDQHLSNVSEEEFADALDDLIGSFVKLSAIWQREYVDWIHPSYRDLVIDELMFDFRKQARFVRNASSVGLGLALSEAGGAAGKRALPFLGNDASWEALEIRLLEILQMKNSRDVERLLRLLLNSLYSETLEESTKGRVDNVLRKALSTINGAYASSDSTLTIDALRIYLSARFKVGIELPVPNLDETWEYATYELRETLEGEGFISQRVVDEWSKLAHMIEMYVPDFYEDKARYQDYQDDRQQLTTSIAKELDEMVAPDDRDDLVQGAERLRSLVGSFEELDYASLRGETTSNIIARLESEAETYDQLVEREEDNERFKNVDDEPVKRSDFDINALFSDL